MLRSEGNRYTLMWLIALMAIFPAMLAAAEEENPPAHEVYSVIGEARLANDQVVLFTVREGQAFTLFNEELGVDLAVWPETIDKDTGIVGLVILNDVSAALGELGATEKSGVSEVISRDLYLGTELEINSSVSIGISNIVQGVCSENSRLRPEGKLPFFKSSCEVTVGQEQCCADCGGTVACGCAACIPNCPPGESCSCCLKPCYCVEC